MGSQTVEFLDLTGLSEADCRQLSSHLNTLDVTGALSLPEGPQVAGEPSNEVAQEDPLPVPTGEPVDDFGFSIAENLRGSGQPSACSTMIDHSPDPLSMSAPCSTEQHLLPPPPTAEPEAPPMEPVYPAMTQIPMYQPPQPMPEYAQHPQMMPTINPNVPPNGGNAYFMPPPVQSQPSPHPLYPAQHPQIYVENCHVSFGNQGHPIYQPNPVAYQQHMPPMYSYYVNDPHSMPMPMRTPEKADYEAQKRYDPTRSNFRGRSRGRGRRKTREELERSHSGSSEHSFGDHKAMPHSHPYSSNFMPYQYYGYNMPSQPQNVSYIPQAQYVTNAMMQQPNNYIYQAPNHNVVPQPPGDPQPEMYVAPPVAEVPVVHDNPPAPIPEQAPVFTNFVETEAPPQPEPAVTQTEEPAPELVSPEPAPASQPLLEPESICEEPVEIAVPIPPRETSPVVQSTPDSQVKEEPTAKVKPSKSNKQKKTVKQEVASVKPNIEKVEKAAKPLTNGETSKKDVNVEKETVVENGVSQEDHPWGQRKVWSELFKESDAAPKKVAYVVPFNGAPKSPEPIQSPLEQTELVGADQDKVNIGRFLKSYKPNGSTNYLLQPRGLINKNYWCYVNAPLQALLACPTLFDLMSNLHKVCSEQDASTIPFMSSICEFFSKFSSMPAAPKVNKKDKGKKNLELLPEPAFEPVGVFKMLLNNGDDKFTEGHQQDAEEMLSFVLNGLQDEMVECLHSIGDLVEPIESETPLNNNNVDDNEEEWQVQGPKKKSCVTRTAHFHSTAISEIFWGQLRSVVQHAGGTMTANLQPFNTLPLDIQSPKVQTLKDALLKLVAKDEITGFTCPKTKQQVMASNQVMLESLPRVLTLQLKRFIYEDGGLQKVTKRLLFPIDLEINRDLLSVNSRNKYNVNQRKYKLFAVVNHEGKEANKGHYVSDIFHNGYNCWLRFDDSSVSQISEAAVLKHEPPRVPYLLFYKRLDSSSPVHNAV